MPDDPREPYGRLVRQVWVTWAAQQENPEPSWLLPWMALDDGQREVDMRIGHAVADCALEQNALTWNTDCSGCAGLLDRAYGEHVRAERAKAALDAACAALARHQHKITDSQGTICAGCLRDWPCPDIRAVEAALEALEASDDR